GGWYATVGGDHPSDRKELYGQAHVLLGASSAASAGLPGSEELLMRALEVTQRFWVAADGRSIESFDRSFSQVDDYRGQNANMHLTEAYLAAYEVTGEQYLLDRALSIAKYIAGGAAADQDGAWRLAEHFNAQWQPQLDHNRDDPRHAFRPYGSQPGHWLEWAKLLMQLKGLGITDSWLLPAARNLFDGAFRDAWANNGGFCYTVDWDGTPVVKERFFWEVAEGIGAAAALYRATGEQYYANAYARLWRYANTHVADHISGSWWHELDVNNRPVVHTWEGKPDLYHAYQATFYAFLPEDNGIAAWVKQPK
ncbi:MAG: N-acylglucosamine 2-epimerase, partial [Propionibacterium sp.]